MYGSDYKNNKLGWRILSQPAFTCSKQKMCEIISKLTIKAAERHQGGHCCAFILVILVSIHTSFCCFYY